MAEAVKETERPKPIGGKTVMGSPVERFEPRPGQTKKDIIDDFHKLSYSAAFEEGLTWQHTKWLGVPMFKMPQDLLTLTEVIGDVKPHLIIETGTAAGGSALFINADPKGSCGGPSLVSRRAVRRGAGRPPAGFAPGG